MAHIGAESLRANAVLDDVGGENHPVAFGRHTPPQLEILGKIVLQAFDAARFVHELTPCDGGRPNGERHPLEHARGERSLPEGRVHADGLQTRPDARSRDRAIGTGGQRDLSIGKFGGNAL